MEACVRGFSFMPDSQTSTVDLQYIEGSELERAWKATRRERLKAQEQRIWSDFVNDHDSSTSVYNNDPYQFLEQLPEGALRELMDEQLAEMQASVAEEVTAQTDAASNPHEHLKPTAEAAAHGGGGGSSGAHTVTFADSDLTAEQDAEIFQLFDDDEDDGEVSVGEENEELIVSSQTTVQPLEPDSRTPTAAAVSEDRQSSKSENMCDVVTNSIYCAKVKELRATICEEILKMNVTVENKLYTALDGEELSKSQKRGGEFCARFNRIHVYQIRRQINDITRNNAVKLPFARHTQFQAQMVRVVSLHQNILHALYALHKFMSANVIARSVCACAGELCAVVREAGGVAAAVPAPPHTADELYTDTVGTSSEMLESALKGYEAKADECLAEYMAHVAGPHSYPSHMKTKRHKKTESIASVPKSNSGSARLSMYTANNCDKKILYQIMKKHEKPKEPEKVKSPKCRRPLMRDPHLGQPKPCRSKHRRPDAEISTLVEAFDPSVTNLTSREPSFCIHLDKMSQKSKSRRSSPIGSSPTPQGSPNASPSRINNNSPRRMCADSPARRTQTNTPCRSHSNTPRRPPNDLSPKRLARSSVAPKNKNTIDSKQKVLPDEGMVKNAANVHVECDLENSGNNEKVKNNLTEEEAEVNAGPKRLCGGDSPGAKTGRTHGARNAQLVCVRASSPKQELGCTPELLKILEKTIQRKKPRPANPDPPQDKDRFYLTFSVPDAVKQAIMQYRSSFLQHMLASPLYANSVLGKPWEVIGSVSDQIIDELVLRCSEDMEMKDVIDDMFKSETT